MLGRKLKAAGRRHGKQGNFGHNGAKSTMPQALFETDENGFFVVRLDIGGAVRLKSRLRQSRGKQILAGHAPKDGPPRARRDSRHKKRRSGAVDRARYNNHAARRRGLACLPRA